MPIEHGCCIEDQTNADEPSAFVPRRGGDSSARTRDTPHLAHCEIRMRNELQDQQREGVVKRGVRKWQSTGVSHFEVDARSAIPSLGVLDVSRRTINATHAADGRVPGNAETKIACAAPDIQDALRCRNPREVNERPAQT